MSPKLASPTVVWVYAAMLLIGGLLLDVAVVFGLVLTSQTMQSDAVPALRGAEIAFVVVLAILAAIVLVAELTAYMCPVLHVQARMKAIFLVAKLNGADMEPIFAEMGYVPKPKVVDWVAEAKAVNEVRVAEVVTTV